MCHHFKYQNNPEFAINLILGSAEIDKNKIMQMKETVIDKGINN